MTSLSPKPIRRVLVAADGRVKMQDQGGYQVLPTDDPDVGADEKVSQRVRPHKESRSKQFSDDPRFQCCMALLIIANAVVIGLETQSPDWKQLSVVENFFLLCFVLEMLIRMFFLGPVAMFSMYHHDFGWNTFDVLVVGVAVVEFIMAKAHGRSSGSFVTVFRTIRLLRILRDFRILKSLKQLYLFAFSLAEAAKAVLWVAMMLFLVMYVSSIVLVRTVGHSAKADPQSLFFNNHFGSITESMITLFLLMSSNLSSHQDEMDFREEQPLFCLFILAFITLASFGVLAMLVGLVTESVLEKSEVRKQEARLEHEQVRLSLGDRSKQLFKSLSLDANGEARVEDVIALAPQMASMLEAAGANVAQYDMVELIEDMDTDGRGTINASDFMQTMQKVAEGLSPLSIQEVHHEVAALHKSHMNSSEKLHDVQHSVNYMMKVMQRLVEQSESSRKGVEDVQQSISYVEAHLNRAPKPLELEASTLRSRALQDLPELVKEMRTLVIERLVDQSESNCELRRSVNDMTMTVQKLVDRSGSNYEAESQSPHRFKTDPSDFAAGPNASGADLVETTLERMAEMLSKSALTTPAPTNDRSEGMAASLLASMTEVISKQTVAIQDGTAQQCKGLVTEVISKQTVAIQEEVAQQCKELVTELISKQTVAIQEQVAQQCKEFAVSQERALNSLCIPQQSIEGREGSCTALLSVDCNDNLSQGPKLIDESTASIMGTLGLSQGTKPLDQSSASALGPELCDFSRESTDWLAQPSGGLHTGKQHDPPKSPQRTRHAERHLDRLLEKMTKVSKQRPRPGQPDVVENSTEQMGNDTTSFEVDFLDAIKQEHVPEAPQVVSWHAMKQEDVEAQGRDPLSPHQTMPKEKDAVAVHLSDFDECGSGYREGELLLESSNGSMSLAEKSSIAEPDA